MIKAIIGIGVALVWITFFALVKAAGLEERIKVLANYSPEGLNYEMIQNLPEIYKNLKMGDVTLFQSDSESELSTLGFAAKSLLNLVVSNKEPNNLQNEEC